MLERLDVLPFQLDHVVPRKHGGRTIDANLCLSCLPCNAFKSSNIAGIDPLTGRMQRLFHPFDDNWDEHFDYRGALLAGKTPIGRATIEVLRINRADRVEHRETLRALGIWP